MIRTSGLVVRLAGVPVLRAIDLAANAGDCIALLGANGAGKSTLLRALSGVLPYEGEITYGGRALRDIPLRERARLVALLPQGAGASWPMTVADVVALGRLPHGGVPGRLGDADAAAVSRAMAACDVAQFAARRVDRLSQGERARVLLARTLAQNTPVLLLDEPTAALDATHACSIMKLLAAQAAGGRAIFAAIHDVGNAAAYFTRRIRLVDGMIDAAPPEFGAGEGI